MCPVKLLILQVEVEREQRTKPMNRTRLFLISLVIASAILLLLGLSRFSPQVLAQSDDPVLQDAQRLIEEGRQTFRYNTFGDEAFWGGQLRLHEAIAGEANGGIGSGLSPNMALELGLKVDAEALPAEVVAKIRAGEVDLNDPATTLSLLQLNAVVGVTGFFDDAGSLTSVGIQCALCHSTVDDSFAPGIGARLDGWANRDLNVGAIVALAPDLGPLTELLGVDDPTVRQVLNSWGPGKYDAELNLDGQALRPDGGSAATLLPAAFGLSGINLHTWTGWGSVTHWNAYVANLQMHGQGTFFDPRLNNAEQFPLAAANGFGNLRNNPDLITSKLAALQFYQLALLPPEPPVGSFDPQAAIRGAQLFVGRADCARCHVPPLFSEPGWPMHTAEEMGIDDFQANRSPDRHYRTAPLAGLWTHQTGGFYHDGRFATLPDVINHYNSLFELELTNSDINDLTQLLLSLPNDDIDWSALQASQSTVATAEVTGVTVQPEVLVSGAVCVIAAQDANVNLRAEPSTEATDMGMLNVGATAQIVGQVLGTDGIIWWQTADGFWVRSDVVTQQQGDCTIAPTVEGS
jgi:hypothetical protein